MIRTDFYNKYGKRLIDISVSFFLLIIFSPLFLIVSILLYFQNDGYVFFFQERPGINATPFRIIKFKSMNDKRDKNGNLLPDNIRLTRLGRVLRKLSIDELPQLVNVFVGDMSLVGPRPLLFKYLELYNEEQRKRHNVKPGITGWAQVNGRNAISWKRKFELDVFYVNNCSFRLDFQILYLTFLKVIRREGINQSESRPMMPFTGNEND
ncbi:sugar transferase [Flavihumibacter sp. RY-1]|uniref:Sugar transferase n=1 Tax=Flavihumibacter fluminis TaxID=2909236 RepID=A0ABS9BMT3_9BACT|nr:sugar transferase [Flavihumibacter fluminis]MCF1716377.1 sugar transferase [Flavihumibacter fluminis]